MSDDYLLVLERATTMKNTNKSPITACILFILAYFIALPLLSAADQAATYTAKPGPYQVDTASYGWHDAARNRDVPVKIYFPHTGDGPFPLIVFSHGLGGTREGYEYLGRHWASCGYVSVHLQHHGSDAAVWQNAHPMESLRQAIKDPANAVNRARDVTFAIDKMEIVNREPGVLKGRIDLQHIGMAGHSFGAWTTLAVAGETFFGPLGGETSLADPRVKAALPMSAPVQAKDKDRLDQIYAKIKIPCLHMTGTLDDSPLGETAAKDRRLPFDHINAADQYLITFNGADHMTFATLRASPELKKKDALFHDLICISSTAFWDAYLKNDAAAKKWLSDGGFKTALDQEGTFEKKEKP
jgi:predicted dienelactone hydrolase